MKKTKARGQTPQLTAIPPPIAPPALNYREERFVDEYLRTGNATQAAIVAGYSRVSAYNQASRMMRNDEVLKTIEAAREQMREKAKVDRNDLIEQLVVVALGDPGDIVAWGPHGVRIKDYKRAGKNRHMVAQISEQITFTEFGKNESRNVKFNDKLKAIDSLWTKLGFDKHSTGRDRQAFAATIQRAMDRVKK